MDKTTLNQLRYSTAYYGEISQSSRRSAAEMLPVLFDILKPSSVIEIGSGTASWLRAAIDLGASDSIAVDGPWVNENELLIEKSRFVQHDLSRPLKLDRKFDLAISLEVAEHLPAASADTMVETLVQHSDCLLFGAAIPLQGGTQHINEQWPLYWIDKLDKRGFECFDLVRPLFWQNDAIAPYYIQNTFLFLRRGSPHHAAGEISRLVAEQYKKSWTMAFVHPRQYLGVASMEEISVRLMLKQGPRAIYKRVASRFGLPKLKASA